MRISDWSSDVCSSDLPDGHCRRQQGRRALVLAQAVTESARLVRADSFPSGSTLADDARRRDPLHNRRPMSTSLKLQQQPKAPPYRSEEHTSELQSLMRISYAVFCLNKTQQDSYTTHYLD